MDIGLALAGLSTALEACAAADSITDIRAVHLDGGGV